MALQKLASASLVQIARGVEEAALELRDSSTVISPGSIKPSHEQVKGDFVGWYDSGRFNQLVRLVQFDVAVHATEGTESKGGIGIVVWPPPQASRPKQFSHRHLASDVWVSGSVSGLYGMVESQPNKMIL